MVKFDYKCENCGCVWYERNFDENRYGNVSLPCPKCNIHGYVHRTYDDIKINTTVIVINGYPRSGKDEFVKIAKNIYHVIQKSTVDTVKKVAKIFGWSGNKNKNSRKMLSDLKMFYTEYFNGPYIECIDLISNSNGVYDFVFLHIREPEEIDTIRIFCIDNDIKFISLFIDRDISEKNHLSKSDTQVNEYYYDYYISNNGTLNEYKEKVYNILLNLIIK